MNSSLRLCENCWTGSRDWSQTYLTVDTLGSEQADAEVYIGNGVIDGSTFRRPPNPRSRTSIMANRRAMQEPLEGMEAGASAADIDKNESPNVVGEFSLWGFYLLAICCIAVSSGL